MIGKMFGTVVLFKPDKGYGFIRQASGEDIFFHVSHFPPGTEPRVGMAVEFRQGTRQAKPIAIDIKPLGDACAILAGGGA